MMKNLIALLSLVLAVALLAPPSNARDIVHHDLDIAIHPEEQRLDVIDAITLPEGHPREFRLLLHARFNPSSPTFDVSIAKESELPGPVPLELFRVTLPEALRSFIVEYGGVIRYPIEQNGDAPARGITSTPGLISSEGVFLSGSSHWYPKLDAEMATFCLEAKLPAGWSSVSQGARVFREEAGKAPVARWVSSEPQPEIYLIAAPFSEYIRKEGGIEAMAFLRSPDEKLSAKYLAATIGYITMYEKLIGPYPYTKFALVENFWETGFGMPSFTLLGPKVIRLPFIINTSYPHEILHNWWGNSVFPEYEKGNWSEGLTAYLADHLMREQKGDAAEYRFSTLQKYADYVRDEKDFPLVAFRSRHSSSSEAIGYGKSLMFFHMLRLELGNEIFTRGLRDFYEKNKFAFASFDELQKSFESASGKDLGRVFDQWTKKPGAPQLKLSEVTTAAEGEGYLLKALLEQVQPEDAFLLRIPLAVTLKDKKEAFQTVVEMKERRFELELHLPARPLRLDVDPEFDLFRKLDREETPPALTQAFGAKKMLIVLPAVAEREILQGYRSLSDALARSGPDEVQIRLDCEVKNLPQDCAVTLLGRENRFLDQMAYALSDYSSSISPTRIRIRQNDVSHKNHSFVITARNPHNREASMTWISCDPASAIPGLGQKLPHYHKYSYLAFVGDEPANAIKGRWPVIDSPMTVFIPLEDGVTHKVDMGEAAPREPIASIPAIF